MNDLPNNAADSGDSDQGALTVTLPIGAANFRLIREYGLYYADKTKFLYPIVKAPLPYFLSRPRRFGKTLLLETLECILRGQKDLFKGLWIDQSNYRWTPYPIIRLEMNKVVENDVETMKETLSHQLAEVAKNEGVENLEKNSPKIMLGDLINSLYQDTHQTVAILIDEYDAPIVEHLSDPPLAEKFRDALREFYGILKTNVKATGHIFVTGVSRFTQTSIFSKLNNLNDLTFNRDYAAICGLTAADLEVLLSDREARTLEILIKEGCLPPESDGRDLRRTIRNWYDGYTWDGETRVYNPWSVLSALNKAEISSDWYTSGTPNFLRQLGAKVLQDPEWINNIPDIQETDTYIDEIDKIPPEVLLLQAGYLTIKDIFYDGQSREFSLEVPNLEVKAALWPLAQALDLVDDKGTAQKWAEKTLDCLLKLDALGVEEAFSFYLNQFKHPSFKTNESQYQIFLETAFRL
ncbi:MAG: AAA family ATPase, partial [Deltaproteobacteria bacterium]|nr:AAA family ATPase [Deltaproteobacteria bacterium]